MDDDRTPNLLTLTPNGPVSQFQSKLAERGLRGYERVRFPLPESESPAYDECIPRPTRTPFDQRALADLNAVADMSEPNIVYFGGFAEAGDVVTEVAARREVALVSVNAAHIGAADLYGCPHVSGDRRVWIAGHVARALQLTTDGEVVLHIEDFVRMDDALRTGLLGLLNGAEVVTFGDDDAVVADLSKLTVLVTDPAETARIREAVGGDAAYQRAFDMAFVTTAYDLYSEQYEAQVIHESVGLSERVAEAFAGAAHSLREVAADPDSMLPHGVPHHTVTKWAAVADAYRRHGIDQPVLQAAENVILTPLYDDSDAQECAHTIIANHAEGAFDWDE